MACWYLHLKHVAVLVTGVDDHLFHLQHPSMLYGSDLSELSDVTDWEEAVEVFRVRQRQFVQRYVITHDGTNPRKGPSSSYEKSS